MYIPDFFKLEDKAEINALIAANSFGLLTSQDSDGALIGSHLPFMYEPERGENGALVAHMAKANPQWRGFDAGGEAMVVFHGPHAYISPNLFDRENAVPTWNYAVVHAYGVPRIMADEAEVRAMLTRLIETNEAAYDNPWTYDGTEDFLLKMIGAIVAFEIPVDRLEAKAKLGQHRPAEIPDIVAGLRDQGGDQSRALADLTERLAL